MGMIINLVVSDAVAQVALIHGINIQSYEQPSQREILKGLELPSTPALLSTHSVSLALAMLVSAKYHHPYLTTLRTDTVVRLGSLFRVRVTFRVRVKLGGWCI